MKEINKLRNEMMNKATEQVQLSRKTKQVAILALVAVSSVLLIFAAVFFGYKPSDPLRYLTWLSVTAMVILILGGIFLPFGKAPKNEVNKVFHMIFMVERANCSNDIVETEKRLVKLKEKEELLKNTLLFL